MTDSLKALGKQYFKLCTDRNRSQSRPFTETEEKELLTALADEVDITDLTIVFADDESPYRSELDLRLDVVVNQRFVTPVLSCPGIMNDMTYTLYRLYHDVLNHVLQNKSFSPFDELLSGLDLIQRLQSKVSPYVLDFIFTDVILMNSVYEHSPKRWAKLQNGTNHAVCCSRFYSLTNTIVLSKA